jgi:hypothetical protein
MAFGLLQSGRAQEGLPIIGQAVRRSEESGLTRSLIHISVLIVALPILHLCGRPDEVERTSADALALATTLGEELQPMQIRGNMAEFEFARVTRRERSSSLRRSSSKRADGARI